MKPKRKKKSAAYWAVAGIGYLLGALTASVLKTLAFLAIPVAVIGCAIIVYRRNRTA